MKLEKGTIVKFKNYIEPDENEFHERYEDKYFEMLDRIQGKIVTVKSTDIRYGTRDTIFEVYEDEFIGEIFPITYLECAMSTTPIEIPKEYLIENCIVQLRSGIKLLYSNLTFFKDYEPYMTLDCLDEDLLPCTTLMGLSNQNDIMIIYKDYKCKEILWERKECKNNKDTESYKNKLNDKINDVIRQINTNYRYTIGREEIKYEIGNLRDMINKM